jgi:NADPH:quinone reductase
MGPSKRVVIDRPGGPDVLRTEEFTPNAVGSGQALIVHRAIGVNFIDTYHRSGLYALPTLPHGLGMEAVGLIAEVREGPSGLLPGQRVACVSGTPGAYATHRLVDANRLIPLPDDVSDETAAAVTLKGMTVEYLIFRLHAVQPGEFVLWHGAAGGLGLIACQWLKQLGARVIGTAGGAEKVEIARRYGCEFPVDYTKEDFVGVVREVTHGSGVAVVYDGVGKATFHPSLDVLKPRGLYVGVGNASGKPPLLDITQLALKGSLYVTRPTLGDYTRTRGELLTSAERVYDAVRRGIVSVHIGQRYAFDAIARAHEDLEARRTVGCSVIRLDGADRV